MSTESKTETAADASAPVLEIPGTGLLHALATGSFARGRSRLLLERLVVTALVLSFGIAAWVIARPSGTLSGQTIYEAPLSVTALAEKASLADAKPLDAHVTPKVDPPNYFEVPAEIAQRVNARIPFSTSPIYPARPFKLTGTPAERERAATCLAMAAYYEAGDDSAGQAAVIQVILNRLRHPAFPKNVCAVVQQGAERTTGCQFTFICDGSMARRVPSPDALARARANAERGLDGSVFLVVGTATHYHTDWVLPRWSAQMDKITAFHGHLFFRWRGGWGMPSAFKGQYSGPEMPDARFLRFAAPTPTDLRPREGSLIAPSTIAPLQSDQTVHVAGMGQIAVTGVMKSDEVRHIYYVLFPGDDYPGSHAVIAWKICAGKAPCTVYGWRSAADIPQLVLGARPDNVIFAFQKSDTGSQQSLWNCRQVARDNKSQCIPGTAPTATASATPLPSL